MSVQRSCSLLLTGLTLAACSGDPSALLDDEPGAQSDAIIRPTQIGGRNEVVLLLAKAVINGQVLERTCSGSYFAPRVVLTAAHCLDNVLSNQLFVYWGDDFVQDFSQLTPAGLGFLPPPPGSNWAQADSFETHPDWDPELIHPDMGVVYLDRKPPFDPLPLARSPIPANLPVVISGWGADTPTGPTTATGARVQRTGTTVTLGSPTEADFHAEDPNPGMLDPVVRSRVLKTDGTPPHSNGCFGDSGGPLIINEFGQDRIAGVDYFGGLFCEDYSLFTRIDPFLPFLDLAYMKGGQASLEPTFQCLFPNASGGNTALFGYENQNGVSITIPHGTKNSSPQDTLNLRPTKFLPGVHEAAFFVDLVANQAVYTLSPDNNPTTTLTVTASSSACGPARAELVECAGMCRGLHRSGCPDLLPFDICTADCMQLISDLPLFAPDCLDEWAARNACYAGAEPGVSNWECIPEANFAFPPACIPEEEAFGNCLFGGG